MKDSIQTNLRQLSRQDQDELALRLELLLTVGKQVEGTSPMVDIKRRPEYLDERKFDSAQKTVNKYFLSLASASSIGLLLLLQLDEILIPLLQTGKSRTVSDLYARYSATSMYIKRCYESRFYDPESEGWQHLNLVRAMHRRIFKIMNDKQAYRKLLPEGERDNSKYVWVNQFDMALTQFAFIGLLVLRPDKCGATNISPREMSEVIYFWRLFSYQLGIEDRFNLFVYHEDISKQTKFLDMILDQYKERLNKPRREVAVEMAKGVLLAFEDFAPEATLNVVEHHWYDVILLTGRKELPPYNGIGELWKLARFKSIIKLASGSEIARRWIVEAYKKKLEKFYVKGDKIMRKLSKKYPNHIYELDDAQGSH